MKLNDPQAPKPNIFMAILSVLFGLFMSLLGLDTLTAQRDAVLNGVIPLPWYILGPLFLLGGLFMTFFITYKNLRPDRNDN
jgi:hypothetical protein